MKTYNAFVYNEETRIHTLGGIEIPSVTNIVAPIGVDYSRIPQGVLRQKRELGINFHRCIELFLKNDLDEDSVDEALEAPMRQFKEFWTDDEFKDRKPPMFLEIEKPLCNKKLKYCGKPDLITEDTIYDWKLRKYDPVSDPIRMAGYELLLPDFPPRRKVVVEFSLDCGYLVHEVEDRQARGMFRKMLNNYWEQINRDKKQREFEELLNKWRVSHV